MVDPPNANTHQDDQEVSYSYYPRRWPWAVIGAVTVLAGVGGLYWSGILHFRSTHQTKVSAVSDANPMVQACASAESGDRWNPQFEPRSLTLGCYMTNQSPQVDGIVWQLWDSSYEGFAHVAVGIGELTINTCTPNCHIGPPDNNLATQQVQVIWVRLRWSDEPSGSSWHRSVDVACLVDPVALPAEVELPVVLEVAVAA